MKLSLVLPMFVLAGWTAFVLLLIPITRFTAAARGKVAQADFKLDESAQVPAWVRLPNRNYMNLLELPVLFYVVCLLLLVTQRQSDAMLSTAWAYVGLRVAHSAIHLTFNQVILRFFVFATSNFTLLALWVLAGIALLPAAI